MKYIGIFLGAISQEILKLSIKKCLMFDNSTLKLQPHYISNQLTHCGLMMVYIIVDHGQNRFS